MEEQAGIEKHRVEALTDGIFAFAMTLLVLGIGVPAIPPGQSPEAVLPGLVLGLGPAILAFAIAFLVLTAFWLASVRILALVAKPDRRLVGLLVVTLLGIVFVPFSSALSSDYGSTRIASWIFALNIAAIGLLSAAQFLYLVRHPALLHAPLTPIQARLGLARMLGPPAAALVAVLVSFVAPGYSYFAYALIPVFWAGARYMWSR